MIYIWQNLHDIYIYIYINIFGCCCRTSMHILIFSSLCLCILAKRLCTFFFHNFIFGKRLCTFFFFGKGLCRYPFLFVTKRLCIYVTHHVHRRKISALLMWRHSARATTCTRCTSCWKWRSRPPSSETTRCDTWTDSGFWITRSDPKPETVISKL